MNMTLRMFFTSSPDNMELGGNGWRTDNILFLHSSGCVSYSSLEYDCVGDYFLCGVEPKLSPTPTYLSFFFSSASGII
jgi:hypothetical protein